MNAGTAMLERVENLAVSPDSGPDVSWIERWIDQIYTNDRSARPLNSFELDRFRRSCRKDYRDDQVDRDQLLADEAECAANAEHFAAMGLTQRSRARAEVARELAARMR